MDGLILTKQLLNLLYIVYLSSVESFRKIKQRLESHIMQLVQYSIAVPDSQVDVKSTSKRMHYLTTFHYFIYPCFFHGRVLESLCLKIFLFLALVAILLGRVELFGQFW